MERRLFRFREDDIKCVGYQEIPRGCQFPLLVSFTNNLLRRFYDFFLRVRVRHFHKWFNTFCLLPFCLVRFPLGPRPWCFGFAVPTNTKAPAVPFARVRLAGEDGSRTFSSRGGSRNTMDNCKKKRAMC